MSTTVDVADPVNCEVVDSVHVHPLTGAPQRSGRDEPPIPLDGVYLERWLWLRRMAAERVHSKAMTSASTLPTQEAMIATTYGDGSAVLTTTDPPNPGADPARSPGHKQYRRGGLGQGGASSIRKGKPDERRTVSSR